MDMPLNTERNIDSCYILKDMLGSEGGALQKQASDGTEVISYKIFPKNSAESLQFSTNLNIRSVRGSGAPNLTKNMTNAESLPKNSDINED